MARGMSHPHQYSSTRDAERLMIDWLSQRLSIQLTPRSYPIEGARSIHIDGVANDPLTMVEAWAHQGRPKSAQSNKVTTDAFKLAFLQQQLGQDARKILLFSDGLAARPFQSGTWRAKAIAEAGIEVWIAELDDEVRSRIRDARDPSVPIAGGPIPQVVRLSDLRLTQVARPPKPQTATSLHVEHVLVHWARTRRSWGWPHGADDWPRH